MKTKILFALLLAVSTSLASAGVPITPANNDGKHVCWLRIFPFCSNGALICVECTVRYRTASESIAACLPAKKGQGYKTYNVCTL